MWYWIIKHDKSDTYWSRGGWSANKSGAIRFRSKLETARTIERMEAKGKPFGNCRYVRLSTEAE